MFVKNLKCNIDVDEQGLKLIKGDFYDVGVHAHTIFTKNGWFNIEEVFEVFPDLKNYQKIPFSISLINFSIKTVDSILKKFSQLNQLDDTFSSIIVIDDIRLCILKSCIRWNDNFKDTLVSKIQFKRIAKENNFMEGE